MKTRSVLFIVWWIFYDITIKRFFRDHEFLSCVGYRDSWISIPVMFRRHNEEDTITKNKRDYKIQCIENGWDEV